MNFAHENVGGDFMELYIFEEVANDVLKRSVGVTIAVFLSPH